MLEKGRREVRIVDLPGHDDAHPSAARVGGRDLVLQTFAVDRGRRGA
jgi:hypothetical protein